MKRGIGTIMALVVALSTISSVAASWLWVADSEPVYRAVYGGNQVIDFADVYNITLNRNMVFFNEFRSVSPWER